MRFTTVIRNDYTNETANVANWLLYSGIVDPLAMYSDAWLEADGKAEEFARENLLAREDPEDLERKAIDELAWSLQFVLHNEMQEITPVCPEDDEDDPQRSILGYPLRFTGLRKRDYKVMSPAGLMLLLAMPALQRVDLRKVAEIIAKWAKWQEAATSVVS